MINYFVITMKNNANLPKIKIWTFEVIVEPVILMKLAPASVATALAKRVLPVPGGPNKSTPLQGCPG